MNLPRLTKVKHASSHPKNLLTLMVPFIENDPAFFDQSHFRHILRVQRMRTERSKKPFLLLLIDISRLIETTQNIEIVDKVKTSLDLSLREIDIRGWYNHNSRTIGVLFTEMESMDEASIDTIVHKIYDRFCEKLDLDWIKYIYISFHIFPETKQGLSSNEPFNINLYPDLVKKGLNKKLPLFIKNIFFDIIGSAIALLLFSPLFLIIAVAIKATSAGPVFFRQKRVGLNGKTFLFLKFRTMTANNDPLKHKEYIKKFINQQNSAATEPGVFKLTNDSRITTVGHFLRKTSFDELPQLINVLKGDMSLVGPRPPIPYECDLYDIWHRRRLLSSKPGITGLWQVVGRSRTTFDEMVRLDLKYLREWSLLLDLKIILMTPKAMIGGSGAF
jgi:lipopolysaccharide/colanic/teichoic acid biosynthesis glycosyltransferase